MKKLFHSIACLFILGATCSHKAVAQRITLHVGPVSIGSGGPNPISIPPVNLVEYELVWLLKNQTEITFGLVPGLLYGYREIISGGFYASVGGGLVISLHGMGPGVYSALGYETCGKWLCVNMEYKQALAHTGSQLLNPYALRIGVGLEY